ncbi:MAG: nickel-dependent hydrogenase large subunit [Deltaproteobacteria bacterium]|nr:nickel-dependent hydrogenase large subunit [Deltaproteobacteria bacterium]
MGRRIVIDPMTRIEGHLRIEVEVEKGRVKNAWSSGMLYRGIETILKGRDPREAWLITQRVCGVCTYVHAEASVRAVENAVGVVIPPNARIIRNLMMSAQFIHDHVVHFYHLHGLDWIDMVSALSADPKKTADLANAISKKPGMGVRDFEAVQGRLKTFIQSGQLGPFANAYWGHPDYRLPPEANLLMAAHYLLALKQQVMMARTHAIFGGKNPHPQSLCVGGVTCGPYLNADRISEYLFQLKETIDFIENIYLPDVLAVAAHYKDWGVIGGCRSYLTWGEFPETEAEPESLYLPSGTIFNKRLDTLKPADAGRVSEDVKRAWYEDGASLHPARGETRPVNPGSEVDTSSKEGKYSWLKAPRYGGKACEVGPLARVLVAYGRGHQDVKPVVEQALRTLDLPLSALFSTLGRTMARAVETLVIARQTQKWVLALAQNLKKGDTRTAAEWNMPDQAEGFGLNDAPRGALGHWIAIEQKKIKNYQMVVPSTWNLGPRDHTGQAGPVEEALIGTPVHDPKRPLEVLRTVHSFDPCIACGVHIIDPETNEVYLFRVV